MLYRRFDVKISIKIMNCIQYLNDFDYSNMILILIDFGFIIATGMSNKSNR